MNHSRWSRWRNLGFFVGLIVIVITVQKSRDFSKLPELEDYKIDLSYFQGRIFTKERVEPGTFAIKQFDFEEIKNWGKDAIMMFDFYYIDSNKRGIVFKVWRPDTETNNVFQYSEKIFKTPYAIASLKREGNVFYANQIRDVGGILLAFQIFSTVSGILIIGCIVFYFFDRKEKEKTTS